MKITASVPTAQFHLADRLPALARAYPKLDLQLHVTDRFVDLVREGFDIAVRSHFAPLPDSELVQRRMKVERITLIASPGYLALRGTPRHPEDLAGHDGLLTGPSSLAWHLRDGDGRDVQVAPIPRLIADESSVLLKAGGRGTWHHLPSRIHVRGIGGQRGIGVNSPGMDRRERDLHDPDAASAQPAPRRKGSD